jgi:hypothetical protein
VGARGDRRKCDVNKSSVHKFLYVWCMCACVGQQPGSNACLHVRLRFVGYWATLIRARDRRGGDVGCSSYVLSETVARAKGGVVESVLVHC